MKIKIKRSKSFKQLMEEMGTIVTLDNGREFMYLPYWFEFDGKKTFAHSLFEGLPNDLVHHIKKHRNG